MNVHVLIPYWGDPGYMIEAVESVLAQTSPHWRLTVIDDAYPDRTVQEFVRALDDPRVRYVRKEHNEGLVANFRSCVAAATEPWMVMLGADDRLLPDYVATVLAAVQEYPEASIIQPGVRVIDSTGAPAEGLADAVKQRVLRPRTRNGARLVGGEELATSLLHGDWLYWPSLAFRTRVIRTVDFRDEFTIILDLDLVLALVHAGAQLLVLPQVTFEYRRHAASESSTTLLDGRRFAGERAFFRVAGEQASARGWHRAARAARLHLTSRLHAATLIPGALARHRAALPTLIRHTLR